MLAIITGTRPEIIKMFPIMKQLEKEVHILTQQKSDLENKAQSQKKQIENLKAIIVQHLKSGCKM